MTSVYAHASFMEYVQVYELWERSDFVYCICMFVRQSTVMSVHIKTIWSLIYAGPNYSDDSKTNGTSEWYIYDIFQWYINCNNHCYLNTGFIGLKSTRNVNVCLHFFCLCIVICGWRLCSKPYQWSPTKSLSNKIQVPRKWMPWPVSL